MPRLAALTRRWKDLPPVAIQLSRIAGYLGVKTKVTEGPGGDPRQQARAAGIPLVEGRLPDDPDIGFLDDSVGLGQGLHS